MEAQTIELVVQAGAVGLCFYLIYSMKCGEAETKTLFGNHIEHNTSALKELSVIMAELKQLIEDKIK